MPKLFCGGDSVQGPSFIVDAAGWGHRGARSIREDLARSGTGKWGEIPTSLVITAGTMLFANQAAPPNLKSLVGRISPVYLMDALVDVALFVGPGQT